MRFSSVGGVGAVVPEMGVGVRAAEGAGVFVGDVDEAGFLGGFEDGVEGGGVFGWFACCVEFAVAVVDGDFVPDADVDGVGVGRGRGRRSLSRVIQGCG